MSLQPWDGGTPGAQLQQALLALGYQWLDTEGGPPVVGKIVWDKAGGILFRVDGRVEPRRGILILSTYFICGSQSRMLDLSQAILESSEAAEVEERFLQIFNLVGGIGWSGHQPGPLARIGGLL